MGCPAVTSVEPASSKAVPTCLSKAMRRCPEDAGDGSDIRGMPRAIQYSRNEP